MIVLSKTFHSRSEYHSVVLQPQEGIATILVWALPRSLATTRGIIKLFSLPGGTKMFQFPPFASCCCMMTGLQPAGLSHSEIRGSKIICIYPRLIAAYHVLHRLCEPRHPPCALSYFILAMTVTRIAEADASETVAVNGSSYFQLYLEIVIIEIREIAFSFCFMTSFYIKDIHSTV